MLFRRLIPTALLLGCAACSSPEVTQAPVPAAEQRRGCVDRFDPAEDLFPEKADIRWAKGFNVTYHGYYKVLEIHGPTPTRLALVRCGAPPPELDIPTVEIPVRSVATTSTTELPHLDALGLVDRWVAHAGLGFVSSDRLRRVIDGGGVAEVGGADGGGLDVERLLEAAPDLLLVDTPERASSDPLRVLAGVGTAVVPIPSYLEQSPLGRTEWLLATALFFDREAEANRLFTDIETAYLDLRLKVEQSDAPRPTVLTGGPWQGVWHVPAGESFMARLLADAGGDFLWADEPGVGPLQLDIEAVYARARDADFWLYPSHWRSLAEAEAVDDRLARFDAFQDQTLFAPDLRAREGGGNDYWELGVFRPDLVLADLVAIFHPELVPEHDQTFHRRLEQDPP